MNNSKYRYLYILWLAIFIAIPLLLVTFYAFTVSDGDGFKFSLDNFRRFNDPIYYKVLMRSLSLALKSTLICLVVGYPLAFIIAREKSKRKGVMLLMIVAPMWMNFLLRTYSWFVLLGKSGLINTFLGNFGLGPYQLIYTDGAVLLGMVYNFLPFMVLPIYSVLSKMDPKLIEAANDLGATKVETFTKVTLPLSVPGIISGVSMVFIPAISTFVISNILGGNKYNLIGNVIEQQFRWTGDWHFGSSMSLILMIFILITMAITNRFGGQSSRGDGLF